MFCIRMTPNIVLGNTSVKLRLTSFHNRVLSVTNRARETFSVITEWDLFRKTLFAVYGYGLLRDNKVSYSGGHWRKLSLVVESYVRELC